MYMSFGMSDLKKWSRPVSARPRSRQKGRRRRKITPGLVNMTSRSVNTMSQRAGKTVSWKSTEVSDGRNGADSDSTPDGLNYAQLKSSLGWLQKIALLRAEHSGLTHRETQKACNDLYKMYKLLRMETEAAFFRDHPTAHLNRIRKDGAANSTAVIFDATANSDSKLLPKFINKLRGKEGKDTEATPASKPAPASTGEKHFETKSSENSAIKCQQINSSVTIVGRTRRRRIVSQHAHSNSEISSHSAPDTSISQPQNQIAFMEVAQTLLSRSKDMKSRRLHGTKVRARSAHRHRERSLQSVMNISTDAAEINFAHRGLGNVRALALLNAFTKMKQLQHLDLSDNRLSGRPLVELITGFKALSRLKCLNLSRNKMRADAVSAVQSLIKHSTTLADLRVCSCNLTDAHAVQISQELELSPLITRFDIAQNRVCIGGGKALANIIRKSKTLKHLNLGENNIRGDGAIAIALAVRHSQSLQTLNFCWNSFGRCNAAICLATSLASNNTIVEVDLSRNEVQTRAAFVLAGVFAGSSTWTKFNMTGNDIGPRGMRSMLRAVAYRLDAVHVQVEDCIRQQAKSYPMAKAVGSKPRAKSRASAFVSRGSGRMGWLTASRIKTLAKRRKKPAERDEFTKLNIAEPVGFYNLDLRNPIQRAVAGELLRAVTLDRGFEISQVSYFDQGPAEKLSLKRKKIVNQAEGGGYHHILFSVWKEVEFKLPLTGRLVFNIDVTEKMLQREHALQATSFKSLVRLLSDLKPKQKSMVLQMCAPSLYFTGEQAVLMIKLLPDLNDRATLARKLSTQIVDATNLAQCFKSTLLPKQIGEMKTFLGAFFQFDPRLPSNSYKLDLSKKSDRLLAARLTAISNQESADRATLVDTSQRGNRTNFRNTTLDGTPFNPPTIGTKPNLNPKASKKGKSGSSALSRWPSSGIMHTDFISLTTPPNDATPLDDTSFDGLCASLRLETKEDEGALISHFVNIFSDDKAPSRDVVIRARSRNESLSGDGHIYRHRLKHSEDLWVSKRSRILKSIGKLGRNIEMTMTNLRRTISGQYVSAQQAVTLMMSFPSCLSARVNCAVALFCCIVDRGNIHLLFENLSEPEQISMGKRIGYLNFFNPEAPDGIYTLDLAYHDERMFAQILVRLAFVEPGENWEDATYKDIEGWRLTKAWERDVPSSGRLHLRYTSAGEGCKPAWIERRRLLRRVLLGDRC